ncbi:MAG: indole-3-glycerol phosphate synthase TrpC [Terriglobia bacterium]
MPTPSQARTANLLERIVVARRRSLEQARQATSLSQLEERAAAAPPVRDFRAALERDAINVIAELKKASPSRGVLRAAYNPAGLAPELEAAGAAALSVLTEPEFFQGGLEDLQVARQVSGLPVLRKDFLFDRYQVLEARAAGADAFLLIAAILAEKDLQGLIQLGRELGMAALVEVHTAEELERALGAGAELLGVNNRNLKTFEVRLETSLELIERIPDDRVAVSESGLRSAEELRRLRAAGFDAFLVGEFLMQSREPAQALARLLA